ncbi:unnamed protein product [Rotaria sordida]|uniref:Uncharacterized protein n=1 Tax=Rotaria sordida TaxID=392033 RepID=A0A814ARX8_9BILA|nr:unnamed protein product [Rotaria sordida]CAF3516233.1 unnamed protein product [Rotaria sordida]
MPSGTNRLLLYLCPIIIFIVFIISRQTNDGISRKYSIGKDTKSNLLEKLFEDNFCSWKFHEYIPSAWETYWFSNIETFQYDVCSILAHSDQVNITIDVLLRIMSLQKTIFNTNSQRISIDNQFSKMHYRRICSNEEHDAIQLIEPLIGFIRDPLTMCPRISSVPSNLYLNGEFALQSKRFLLLAPSSPFHIDPPLTTNIPSLAPWLYSSGSQKILIDIGSSYFKSRHGNIAEIGTKWFYDYFKEKSIRFDRIIAYEYQQLDTRRVWNELPDDVYPIYTFINVGVETEIEKFNPWKMLQTIAKPNDYVVIKLDIDKPPLENALMKQLLDENNQARYLIDELFFEKHVTYNRKSKEDKLKDSYELFTKLRRYGIRMHGWP